MYPRDGERVNKVIRIPGVEEEKSLRMTGKMKLKTCRNSRATKSCSDLTRRKRRVNYKRVEED